MSSQRDVVELAFPAMGRQVRRVAHAAAWLVGAFVLVSLVVLPLGVSLMITHAPRNAVAAR